MHQFEFSQSITEDEWVKLIFALSIRKIGVWNVRIITAILGLTLIPLLSLVVMERSFSNAWLPICVIAGIPALIIWRLHQAAKKQYRTMATLQHPISYVIDESGVQVKAHGISSVSEWMSYTGLKEVHGFLLMYRSAEQAEAIKLSAIPPDALAFIQARIPPKK